jgi:MoxR-like ATPase
VRGSIALERAVRAWALISGRDYVEPPDVEALFVPVVGHRVLFSTGFLATMRGLDAREALEEFQRRALERAPHPEPGQ